MCSCSISDVLLSSWFPVCIVEGSLVLWPVGCSVGQVFLTRGLIFDAEEQTAGFPATLSEPGFSFCLFFSC
jgi:hypothetical protein